MSMVDQIMKSIKIAKVNLGDLVRQATLVSVTGTTYAGGTYTPTTVETPVDLVIDRFSVEEKQAAGFKESDLKVSVFNNEAMDLVIDVKDQIRLDGVTYGINSCDPAYVGPIKAVFELKLRK